jgi:hypothetical protein
MSINQKEYKFVAKNLKINHKNNRESLLDFRLDNKRYCKV